MAESSQPSIVTDVSIAVLLASPAVLAVGTVVTAMTEGLGLVESADAFWRTAIYLVIPALVSVALFVGVAVGLESLRERAPRASRWTGIVGLFVAVAATLHFASRVFGLEGFEPFAVAGAALCTWVGARMLDEPLRLDRAEAWLPGLFAGAAVTTWVDATFELRHSIVSDFMDPNAILLTACAGLTVLAGFALAGVVAPEHTEDAKLALGRALLCAVAAVGLAWGNRVVMVPRLYLEAHIAVATFEWVLWIGAFSWALFRVDRGLPGRRAAMAWGGLVVMSVASAVVPSGDGIRPLRLDYAAQTFALSLGWTDRDGDGFLLDRLGGVDCSERDDTIHPFARERGGDENCTGGVDIADDAPTGEREPLPTADLVVVVTVDTLRPDFVSLYGSNLDTTPRLAEIDDWAVFDAAYTSGGITTLAVASFLRGRLPLAIDLSPVYRTVDRRYVFPDEREPSQRVNRVFTVPRTDKHRTVADVFSRSGRRSYAFVDDGASRVFQEGLGYEQGFDEFTFPNAPEGPGEGSWDRETLTTSFVDAIPTLEKGAFVWLHYYDPHNAKGPCRKFDGMPRIGCYPDAIWDVDAALGRVVDALKENDRWDETLFVVTSDHGEALGEHGLNHHGLDSYEEFVRIPMLVHGPGVAPGRVGTPVSLIDATATAVAAAGLEVPNSFQGYDLRRTQRGTKRPVPVLSQLLITSVDGRPYRQQTLLVEGTRRYMWDRVTHRGWMFDLERDPDQLEPRRGDAADRVRPWIDVLEAAGPSQAPVVFPTTPLR